MLATCVPWPPVPQLARRRGVVIHEVVVDERLNIAMHIERAVILPESSRIDLVGREARRVPLHPDRLDSGNPVPIQEGFMEDIDPRINQGDDRLISPLVQVPPMDRVPMDEGDRDGALPDGGQVDLPRHVQ